MSFPEGKCLVAFDSFKDALPSEDVCEAVVRGLRRACPSTQIVPFPLADGGEGTARLLTRHNKGVWHNFRVSGPRMQSLQAGLGISPDGRTAWLDLAEASGLHHLPEARRDPEKTTTYGTGELIQHALDLGARRIFLGLGGSATNDCGMGMAAALGYRFPDENGKEVKSAGGDLHRVQRIDAAGADGRLAETEFLVACDVDNPLYGPYGAAYTYAPQKGADAAAVERLDAGLRHFSERIKKDLHREVAEVPGAGAAGGMGAGALAFLNARLQPGADLFFQLTGFAEQLQGCDLLFTGEGRIDRQTLHGKVVRAVVRLANHRGIPVIGLCGQLDADAELLEQIGLRAAFSISNGPQPLPEALASTERDLEAAALQIGRMLSDPKA